MTRLRDLPPAVRRAVQLQNRAETERQRRVFVAFCVGAGLPAPVAEHAFMPGRRFRFDWAWPQGTGGVALEIDGAVWGMGPKCSACGQRARKGHGTGSGIKRDIEKLSEAAAMGWLVIRTLPEDLGSGVTLDRLRRALAVGG